MKTDKKTVKENAKKVVPNYAEMIRLYGATYVASMLNQLAFIEK